MKLLSTIAIVAMCATDVFAHPGHDVREEAAERAAFLKEAPRRDLSHCAAELKARGITQNNIRRRAAIAKAAREKRGIAHDAPFKRSFADVLATNHTSPVVYTPETDNEIIFAGQQSCVLQPETTEGPYYVAGEYVRQNLVETQQGVELILDTQVIDVATCKPVPDVYVEIWSCNSTGVYGGVVANGNGNGNPNNINSTFLRGIQKSDDLGVATFTTIFPGHYTGRAPHIHTAAHFQGTKFANGTYAGGYVSHIGQIFFDQNLITAVESTKIYTTNKQSLVLNAKDSIFAAEAASNDPVIEYSLLGKTIDDGVFGWVAFGIDLSRKANIKAAVTLTDHGGVRN